MLAVKGLLEEQKDMKSEGTQRNFYAQERVLRQLPLFVGICKLDTQTVLKGSREGWKEMGLLRTWGRKWNFCPPVFPQKWLISHLAHEKVSVHEWVNFVYCFWYAFFSKSESCVHSISWEVEDCYRVRQWHEYSLILSRFPGLEILMYGLAKKFALVFL